MKKSLLISVCFLTACAPEAAQVKHLGPSVEPVKPPAICKIVGILPDSPAIKGGLKVGDEIKSVNGTKPADAAVIGDLVQASGTQATFEVSTATGSARTLKITLNKDKPRLGAVCDLAGWHKNSVSAAGNESVTVFGGPYALTASGIIDKGITFMRVRISNHSDRDLAVRPEQFSVSEGPQSSLKVLMPQEVIYFMHGNDAVPLVKSPNGEPLPPVPMDSPVRTASKEHRKKSDWSQSDENYVNANANYLNKESLWPANVIPGKFADGLIYFLEPHTLPVTIEAHIEGQTLTTRFGTPQPSTQHMTQDQLEGFFEAQKKGTPLRLTLKGGKVFVGKYSSYDALNETVWFDTPSGVLLTTSSFGLKYIDFAEVISPDADKKPSPSTP